MLVNKHIYVILENYDNLMFSLKFIPLHFFLIKSNRWYVIILHGEIVFRKQGCRGLVRINVVIL